MLNTRNKVVKRRGKILHLSRIAGQYYFINSIYFQGYKKFLLLTLHETIQLQKATLVIETHCERTMEDQEPFPVQLIVRSDISTDVCYWSVDFPYYHLMVPALNKVTYTMQLTMKPAVY